MDIGEKAACKMLVKLTTGQQRIGLMRNQRISIGAQQQLSGLAKVEPFTCGIWLAGQGAGFYNKVRP